jgi:hypothetical protein
MYEKSTTFFGLKNLHINNLITASIDQMGYANFFNFQNKKPKKPFLDKKNSDLANGIITDVNPQYALYSSINKSLYHINKFLINFSTT